MSNVPYEEPEYTKEEWEEIRGRPLFELRDGRQVLDIAASEKLYQIMEEKPEAPHREDTGYEWNDAGMAELFAKLYDHEARYCPEHKVWYTYHSGAWREDVGALLAAEKLKEFMRLMILYCGEILDDARRKDYTAFVNRMGDRRMRERILKDAAGKMIINAVEFDSNPNLINCLNGTYDLSTFTFRPARWQDFITMQTNFKHSDDIFLRCPRWEQFVDEVTEGDKLKAKYLQRALGYSLLGKSNEECMFILHGKTTRNGKSTMLNTIEYMLGDYSTVSPVGLICKSDRKKDEDAATPSIIRLKGKRFVTMAESNEYGQLDEERIKLFTGGEAVTGRALYQSAVTFIPQFTMWLSCNDLPAVRDKSLFASDRVRVIEFNRHFKPEEQDKDLKESFMTQESMTGIFQWLVNGYKSYTDYGLVMPEHMTKVVRKYEQDNDLVLQFLTEKCVTDDEASIKCSDLYKAYKAWCRGEGLFSCSSFKFRGEMERHPEWFKKISLSAGVQMYRGLRLKGVQLI